MTKAEIVSRICEKNRISNTDAANIVEATFEVIKAALERGENVKLMNFGQFAIRAKNARRGRNPHTKVEIVIPAHKVVTFSAGPAMKKAVNTFPWD